MNHSFSLIVDGIDPHASDLETRFHEAGCDDATVCLQAGELRLDFDREGGTREAAIASARRDVEAAGARVVRQA